MNLSTLHSRLPKRSLLFIAVGLFLLSFVSAWYFKAQPSIEHQKKLLQHYVTTQQRDAQQLLRDSNLMRKLVLKTESVSEFQKLYRKEYGLFLFAETISDNQDILFWNNQKILPPTADFTYPDGYYFQHLENGYYVVSKTTLRFSGMSNNVVAYVLIPILNQYYVETDYLVTSFVHSSDAVNKISIWDQPTKDSIRSLNGSLLFFIKEVSHSHVAGTDLLTVVLRLTALLFLFIYTGLLAETIARRTRPLFGIGFLIFAFAVFMMLI